MKILLLLFLLVLIPITAYATHQSTTCNISVSGQLFPVLYNDEARSNPDNSFYPGDGFHFLFKYRGSNTCGGFGTESLKSGGTFTVLSHDSIIGSKQSGHSHHDMNSMVKKLKVTSYYEILNTETEYHTFAGGGSNYYSTTYTLSESPVFSWREDQELSKRDGEKISYYSKNNGKYKESFHEEWGIVRIKENHSHGDAHKFEKNNKIQIIPIYFEKRPTLDDVLSIIAMHLGMDDREFVGRDKQEIILSRMQNKKILCYADAFEVVSEPENEYGDESGKIIEFLNRLPSNILILATSRNNRNFLNETLIPLEELDMESAIQLFACIAKIEPKSEIQNIEKIISLAANHPLAIEIIAHSYEGQGLANLILDIEKYGITSSKYGTTNQRQHMVESCIKYSFDKLDSQRQALLKNLAQLHSPFPSNLAQTFDATSSDLPYLYNRTMITKTVKSNYGDLDSEHVLYDFHSLVKDYVRKIAEKLDHSKVSQYYLKFLEDTYNSLNNNYTSQNVRQMSILLQSEENDLTEIISINNDEIQKDSSSCFTYVGLILEKLGHYSKSLFYHNKALEIHSKMGYVAGIGKDHRNIGVVLDNLGRYQKALESHNKALEIHTKMGDIVGLWIDRINIGIILHAQGNLDDALQYAEESLNIFEKNKNYVSLNILYDNIGYILQDMKKEV